MTPERWQQIGDLLDMARGQPVSARPAFLADACGDDVLLRDEVESLLDLDEQPGFLDQPVLNLHGKDPDVGQHIGPYEIVDLLGRGGMGAVYLARRRGDYRQRVALKLIKRGMDSDEIVRRFENERQILADLDHPNIARLMDGGTADDGRPYLVMEYVEGEAIDRYCDRHQLSTHDRLKLFLKVCSAVNLSHQKLVVHRDLKPSNILVSGDGVPKLLDFGIAKLLEAQPAFRTLATMPDHRPMTLKFASPEQVRGDVITTASDTYSLGVLLYRLLTGHHPNDLEDSALSSASEAIRRICEHEPRKPSTAIREHKTLGEGADVRLLTPESISRARDGDPRRLSRRLKGDVDAIVLKALRKEPNQRYGSVEQFAEDIRRYLDGLPVTARKGTFTYLTSKFVRRNRIALAVALLILGFSVTTTLLWREAVDERQQAEQARHRAGAALGVVWELVQASDPSRQEPGNAQDVLKQNLQVIGKALEGDPQQWASLANLLTNIYHRLGLYQEARAWMEAALGTMKRQYPEGHPILAEGLNNLGAQCYEIGDRLCAETYFQEALEMRRQLGQEDAVDSVRSINNLAAILMQRGDFERAEELYRRGLKIRMLEHRLDHPYLAPSFQSLGNLSYVQGDFVQARRLLRRALDIRLKDNAPEEWKIASVLDKLGSVSQALGDHPEAEALLTEALNLRRKLVGEDHPKVAFTQANFAALLLEGEASREELETIAILLQRALATLGREKAEGAWEIAWVESLLGSLLTRLGRFEEAESCLIESRRLLQEIRGVDAIYSRAADQRLQDLYRVWRQPGASDS